jgi:hypothetical protein
MNKDDLLNKIAAVTDKYDSENNKNRIFKTSQKMERAARVSESVDLTDLLENTIYNMPNTNRVFIEYPVFKKYAHPDIYANIVNHFIRVLEEKKNQYGNFQIYVNLETITVSAVERHKSLMKLFSDTCITQNRKFSCYLEKCIFYNMPNIIDAIKIVLFPFVMPQTRKIIEFFNKEQTDKILHNDSSAALGRDDSYFS